MTERTDRQNQLKCPDWMLVIFGLYAFLSPMGILQIGNNSLFFISSLLLAACILAVVGRMNLHPQMHLMYFFLLLTITTAFAVLFGTGTDWIKRALKGYLSIVSILIVLLYVSSSHQREHFIQAYKKGIRAACDINIIWSLLQILCFRTIGLDINNKIFVQWLHIVQSASMYRGGRVCCSGLHRHPGNLAPLLVLGFFLSDSFIYKIFICIAAVFSYNTTCIVGVSCCVAMHLFYALVQLCLKPETKNSQKKRFAMVAGLLFIIFMILAFNRHAVWQTVNEIVSNFMDKISFSGNDNSSLVHLRYYQMIPDALSKTPFIKVLVGYGYGCSGYIYTKLTGQYSNLASWSVESDVVNSIFGLGIINTVVFYAWLIKIAVKGVRINAKYVMFMIIIMIQGLSYNVQWDWVILLEGMLMITEMEKCSFFGNSRTDHFRIYRNKAGKGHEKNIYNRTVWSTG